MQTANPQKAASVVSEIAPSREREKKKNITRAGDRQTDRERATVEKQEPLLQILNTFPKVLPTKQEKKTDPKV